jgi:hypothetical protein
MLRVLENLPFPEVMRSANRFIAESPAASIGVLVGRGGDLVGGEADSISLIGQHD